MENESGRTFKFELGRMEKDEQTAHMTVDSAMESHPQTQTKDPSPQATTSQTNLNEEKPEPARHWVRYHFDQTKEEACQTYASQEGVCFVQGIKFRLNDELGERTVKSGTYELRISDVTKNMPARMKTTNVKILVKFVDLDEEAAMAAAAAQAA